MLLPVRVPTSLRPSPKSTVSFGTGRTDCQCSTKRSRSTSATRAVGIEHGAEEAAVGAAQLLVEPAEQAQGEDRLAFGCGRPPRPRRGRCASTAGRPSSRAGRRGDRARVRLQGGGGPAARSPSWSARNAASAAGERGGLADIAATAATTIDAATTRMARKDTDRSDVLHVASFSTPSVERSEKAVVRKMSRRDENAVRRRLSPEGEGRCPPLAVEVNSPAHPSCGRASGPPPESARDSCSRSQASKR